MKPNEREFWERVVLEASMLKCAVLVTPTKRQNKQIILHVTLDVKNESVFLKKRKLSIIWKHTHTSPFTFLTLCKLPH